MVVVVVVAASRKREKKKKKKLGNKEGNGRKNGGGGMGGGDEGRNGGAKQAPRVNGELRLRRQLRSLKVLAAISEATDMSGGNEISAFKRRQQQRHGNRSSFRRTQEYAERKREAQEDEERERVRDLYAPSNPLEEWMVQKRISLSPAGLYGGDTGGNKTSSGSGGDDDDDDAEDRGGRMSTLFIDGYNVVGASADLSAMRDASKLWEARDELHARTSAFCRRLGGDVVPIVVWDARSAPGRAAREELHERHAFVRAVHTYDADMWIEARVASMCDDVDGEHASIWVATSDNLLAQSCFGMGAMIVSSRILLEEMASAAAADAMTARAAAKAASVRPLPSGGGRGGVNVAMDGISTNIDHSLGNGGAEVLSALRTRILHRERSRNRKDSS